jgi:hypothetical protein
MAAGDGKQRGRRQAVRREVATERAAGMAPRADVPVAVAAAPARRRAPAHASGNHAQRTPGMLIPAVAPCADLDTLRSLSPEDARAHVDAYLHAVMAEEEADAFEALSYRWELHLVELDQLCLLRSVDLASAKLRRYRAAVRRGSHFPPLVGLGGDGRRVTDGVLLCDGYHRAVAMRDAGIHYVWVWLAAGMWEAKSRRSA